MRWTERLAKIMASLNSHNEVRDGDLVKVYLSPDVALDLMHDRKLWDEKLAELDDEGLLGLLRETPSQWFLNWPIGGRMFIRVDKDLPDGTILPCVQFTR